MPGEIRLRHLPLYPVCSHSVSTSTPLYITYLYIPHNTLLNRHDSRAGFFIVLIYSAVLQCRHQCLNGRFFLIAAAHRDDIGIGLGRIARSIFDGKGIRRLKAGSQGIIVIDYSDGSFAAVLQKPGFLQMIPV